jgi:DnaJ-class molecular chaperone
MSYYDLLEITRDATQEEIKKAYRKMAVKHHPDKGGDEEVFKKVSEAYTVLSDESKKRVYDMGGDPNTQSGNPFNMGGGFNFNMGGGGFPFNMGGSGFPFNFNMGGGGFKQDFNQEKLKDIEVVMEVTLEELYTSVEKSLTIRAEEKCSCIKVCDMC